MAEYAAARWPCVALRAGRRIAVSRLTEEGRAAERTAGVLARPQHAHGPVAGRPGAGWL